MIFVLFLCFLVEKFFILVDTGYKVKVCIPEGKFREKYNLF